MPVSTFGWCGVPTSIPLRHLVGSSMPIAGPVGDTMLTPDSVIGIRSVTYMFAQNRPEHDRYILLLVHSVHLVYSHV